MTLDVLDSRLGDRSDFRHRSRVPRTEPGVGPIDSRPSPVNEPAVPRPDGHREAPRGAGALTPRTVGGRPSPVHTGLGGDAVGVSTRFSGPEVSDPSTVFLFSLGKGRDRVRPKVKGLGVRCHSRPNSNVVVASSLVRSSPVNLKVKEAERPKQMFQSPLESLKRRLNQKCHLCR